MIKIMFPVISIPAGSTFVTPTRYKGRKPVVPEYLVSSKGDFPFGIWTLRVAGKLLFEAEYESIMHKNFTPPVGWMYIEPVTIYTGNLLELSMENHDTGQSQSPPFTLICEPVSG